MKPRIKKLNKTLYKCYCKIATGYGKTMKEAYDRWNFYKSEICLESYFSVNNLLI